jgi:hypothetical protein
MTQAPTARLNVHDPMRYRLKMSRQELCNHYPHDRPHVFGSLCYVISCIVRPSSHLHRILFNIAVDPCHAMEKIFLKFNDQFNIY